MKLTNFLKSNFLIFEKLCKILKLKLPDLEKNIQLLSLKGKIFETLIDRIYASLPVEVQEARAFLRRRDELQVEAQQRAEKIIKDAQAEADRILSESEIKKVLERDAMRIKNQVQQECEELKNRAVEEAENIRMQATEEATKTKNGAELYAEQVLNKLEISLAQQQQEIKNAQIYYQILL